MTTWVCLSTKHVNQLDSWPPDAIRQTRCRVPRSTQFIVITNVVATSAGCCSKIPECAEADDVARKKHANCLSAEFSIESSRQVFSGFFHNNNCVVSTYADEILSVSVTASQFLLPFDTILLRQFRLITSSVICMKCLHYSKRALLLMAYILNTY